MRNIDTKFILLGLVALVVGLMLGVGMGIAHNFQFTPVHAHLNLVGFVSSVLFGLVYRAYPALAQSRLASVHFALAVIGVLIFPAGIYVSIAYEQPVMAIVGSLIWFASVLVFMGNFLRVTMPASTVPYVAPAE